MSNSLFIFVDETGDLGDGTGDSSPYYAELAVAIEKEYFPDVNRPLLSWRYCRNLLKEMDRPPKKEHANNFLNPFVELCRFRRMCCSCVYLLKEDYTGPYLKPNRSGYDPKKFKNFIHRQLFEWHFSVHPPRSENIEIVFDRFEVSEDDMVNLGRYLRNNWNLPNIKHIVHTNSIYVETLQLAHQLVNLTKDVIMGTATFDTRLLSFVQTKDITAI